MNGRISVIVPVYNAGAYLDQCMESLLGQTCRHTEILLIDDGSTDGSGEKCDAYAQKDARIRVIHKPNGGASTARNAGLREAKGDYIYFLDSDDYIEPTLLQKVLESAEETGAELVFFDAWALDEDTGHRSEANYGHKERYAPEPGAALMAKMVKNRDFHMGVWQLFYKKSFFDRTGLTFEEGIIYEDFLFTCKAYCLAERVSYVPEFLYTRRYRANSVMTAKKTMKNFTSAETVYYAVRDFAEENGAVPAAYLARGAFNAITCYEALSGEEKKEAKARVRAVKKDILAHGAYGDPALKARCYGKPLWAACRGFQKIFG